jgi:hypothetical protein
MDRTQNTEGKKSMFTVETKSMLAKLMAAENIKVEHRVCKTASFNLKTRTLTCPIWTNMTGDLYDLLMGHEVSHAKNTPMNGWHDSVVYAGGDKKASAAAQKAFKNFLNVVEDARIEKLIKRTYPGLRQPMIRAYKELVAKDFFGLSAISNFNELYLIDRLNLAAKCGSALNIKFSKKEQPYYDEMMTLETWDQVVSLAKKLYKHSVDEQKQGEQKKKELADHLKDSIEYDEEGEDDDGEKSDWDEDYDSEETEQGDRNETGSDDLDSDEEEDSDSADSDKDGEDDSDAEGDKADGDEEEKADDSTTKKSKDDGEGNRTKKEDKKPSGNKSNADGAGQQENSNNEEFVPKAKTDESFRNMEQKLIDDKDVVPMDVIIPTPNLKDLVAPAAIVNDGLSKFYSNNRALGVRLLNEFKQKNDDYISLLAKEFEMKKAARSYAKAKIADSGDININKLATYMLEDHMFKKLMIVHKGKSHGLVLILDKSGSMSDHIEAAMEQILVMALFCRKVNIPFVAYSFTDNSGAARNHDFPGREQHSPNPLKPYSKKEGEMVMGNIDLREMFNSKMPAHEFTQAITNHLMLVNGFGRQFGASVPDHERMGSTPLNEALVALRDIIRNFKKAHRLDIVNAIVVHDGDSDGNRNIYDANENHRFSSKVFDANYNRVTLIDQKEHLHIDVPKEYRGITIALMKWLQMTAHCGVFGFYIAGNTAKSAKRGILGLYQNKQGIRMKTLGYSDKPAPSQVILLDQLCKEVIEKKFLESYSDGYTRFYFIPGSAELKTSNATMTAAGNKWTPHRLLTAFKKVHQKRRVSRVLVNRFIELMSV